MTRDRRAAVIASNACNGIDFVEIANAGQTQLVVHFLNAVEVALAGTPTITGGERIATVPVLPVDGNNWGWDEEHLTLALQVDAPGDFSTYTLAVPSPDLDEFFDHVGFSFKANCPSDLDCEAAAVVCPPVTADVPPINYLAKDFQSFRQALLDFSVLRYPQWQERSEGDFGIMFLEALSALADDLSYTQDRIAAEAMISTATQRRSIVRHARLVDYQPSPTTSSTVFLQFELVQPSPDGPLAQIPFGVQVSARAPDGTLVPFETGTGLRARLLDNTGRALAVSPGVVANYLWNAGNVIPYWFDDSCRCLQTGATQMYVLGHGFNFQPQQQLLVETQAETSADPPIRQIVTLLAAGDPSGPWASEEYDPLFFCSPPSPLGTPITRIAWQPSDKLVSARDLTRTTLAGNIVLATQGATIANEQFFTTVAPPGSATPTTIVRTGGRPTNPDGTPGTPPSLQLYTLANAPLAYVPQLASDGSTPLEPEIVMSEAEDPIAWSSVPSLLQAQPSDTSFTLDSVRYSKIAQNSDGTQQYDYDGDTGDTIRFGDSIFGLNPDDGTFFTVTYRTSAGAAGNVAADAVTIIRETDASAYNLESATNPLPATGGVDSQPLESVQRLAPQWFRNQLLRAVLPPDYVAAAEQLQWVENAGTTFRWTGSWLTVFTTPQAVGSETISIAQQTQLIDLLNRYRMAGYESYVPSPRYLSIDLLIELCAQPTVFTGDVEGDVVAALSPAGPPGGPPGFFAIGAFTFGQSLWRSSLEAAIQAVFGVAGVLRIRVRVRGQNVGFVAMHDAVNVAIDQIIRCDNDPSAPERGSISVVAMGGR